MSFILLVDQIRPCPLRFSFKPSFPLKDDKYTPHFNPQTICALPVGHYTRKYIHNYYSRKRYLEGLKTKNSVVRYWINCYSVPVVIEAYTIIRRYEVCQNIFHQYVQIFSQERVRSMENKFRT